MFSTFFTVALFFAPAIQGVFAQLAVNNPDFVQCQSARISWPATKGPYDLVIVEASNPCGTPLADLGEISKTYVDWNTTIPSGTVVQVSLVDANDDEAWSANITVGASPDGSCLSNGGSSNTNSAATPSSTPATTYGTTNTGSTGSTGSGGSGSSTNGSVTPLGAANAGTLGNSSGALSAHQVSKSLLAIAGLAAALALSL